MSEPASSEPPVVDVRVGSTANALQPISSAKRSLAAGPAQWLALLVVAAAAVVADQLTKQIIGRTLELGCGEGRVARDLAERGHHVTALDSAAGLVRHARAAAPEIAYLVAGAARLPIHDGGFDLVVAYNSLQVVDDMAASVRECERVLRPGGRLCFCVAHPVTDMGRWIEHADGATFAVRRSYFERARVEDTVEREGLRMTFRGWTHTLEDYAVALGDAGFAIDVIREPVPSPGGRFRRWSEVPLFMNVRAVRR